MTTDTAGKEAARLVRPQEMHDAPSPKSLFQVDYAEMEARVAAIIGGDLETLPFIVKMVLDQFDTADVVEAVKKGFELKLAELRQEQVNLTAKLSSQVENGSMSHGERTARVGNISKQIAKLVAASSGLLK